MKAMILSAGRGQRMKPLTDITPKPLLKIGDKALIEYHLLALAHAGIHDIVINVSYHPQQFVNTLGDGSNYGVTIHYSFEPEESFGLETGGGIFQALPLLGNQPFIAISADLWTDYSFARLPKQLTGLAHVVMVDNPDFHQEGDFCLIDGNVYPEGKNKLNFGGIGVYHPDLFLHCTAGKFPLAPLLVKAMKNHQVAGEHYKGMWENIGTVEQFQELQLRSE